MVRASTAAVKTARGISSLVVAALGAIAMVAAGCIPAPATRVPGFLFHESSGSGSPAVIFEADLGDADDAWRGVAYELASETRVVTYDRAGLGRSAPAEAPRTAARIAGELHEALAAWQVSPPYVLVAHSAGAWFALVYASLHPGEVAGLVLVDPTPFGFFREAPALMTADERRRFDEVMSSYRGLARPGRREEWDARAMMAAEAERATLPDSLPITILTATTARADQPESVRRWWADQNRAWAARLPGARQTAVEGGRYLQLERPEAVEAAVHEMIARARRTGIR